MKEENSRENRRKVKKEKTVWTKEKTIRALKKKQEGKQHKGQEELEVCISFEVA